MNEYNKELCTERHLNIERDMKTLFCRLNWFYVIAIATLAAVIGQYFR